MKTTPLHKKTTAAMTLGFTGVAGFHFWDGHTPNPDGSFPVNLWKPIYRAQVHMNGQDVISTLGNGSSSQGWMHVKEDVYYDNIYRERYSVEHQYYRSNDKRYIVGYVKNRSYNINTKGIPGSDCKIADFGPTEESPRDTKWDDVKKKDRLRIRNLKTHTEYRIDWYSAFKAQNNGYIKTDCIQTNKKDGDWGITLEYPELTVSNYGNNDLPVVWYVAYQKDCNSGMRKQLNSKEKKLTNLNRQVLENKEQKRFSIVLYPNPFHNAIYVESLREDHILIKSIEGKILKRSQIKIGRTKIDIPFLAKGIYFIVFEQQNITKKIIKQ